MAFEDRDTVVPHPVNEVETVETVVFERVRSLPGVQLRVTVTYEDKIQGTNTLTRRLTRTVPQSVVDANWPGPQRTLKAWLLAIIDAAV